MNIMTISKSRKSLAVVAIVAAIAMLASPSVAAPRADAGADSWTLEINYSAPLPIVVKLPGQQTPQLFWYFTYTVANHTGQDQMFTPEIILYTATGQIIQAGAGINPYVYRAIKKIHNEPLLLDGLSVMGKLLQGEDNAKSAIAVFRNFDPKAAEFDIFFSGLSGDSVLVKLPTPIKITASDGAKKNKKVKKSSVILTKTLWLSYRIGTEAADRAQAKPKLISKSWIMR
ncbi:MAG: hypothetical protein DRP83_00855 [Planctomycetota bacterium]|nr:MAG: hypothetical protein DRP83_00855 [Planctomycetota bacterium]